MGLIYRFVFVMMETASTIRISQNSRLGYSSVKNSFHSISQLFSASVLQEISFGPMNLGLTEEEVRYRVRMAMAATKIENLADKPTHMLSFGQKKGYPLRISLLWK